MQCFVTLMVAKSIAIHICWVFWPVAFSIIASSFSYIFMIHLVNYYSSLIQTSTSRYSSHVLISSISVCQVPKSEVFYSLNASIVGLAVDSENFPDCMGLGKLLQQDSHTCVVILPVLLTSLKRNCQFCFFWMDN